MEKESEKVTFSSTEIQGIAKAIALADMAARAPKEKNPRIPMVEDELYHRAMKEGVAKYNSMKAEGKI